MWVLHYGVHITGKNQNYFYLGVNEPECDINS